MPVRLTVFFVAMSLIHCTGDLVPLGEYLGVPRLLDFGDVSVGPPNTIVVTLQNPEDHSVDVEVVPSNNIHGEGYAFSIAESTITIHGKGTAGLFVSFEASQSMARPVESSFELRSFGGEATILLRGRGVYPLILEPSRVDFGSVMVGMSRESNIVITNNLPIQLSLFSEKNEFSSRPLLIREQGHGEFTVNATVSADGLIEGADPLPVGASLSVPISYRPIASQTEDMARWTIRTCERHPLCKFDVKLSGRALNQGISCEENVEMGSLEPGEFAEEVALCTVASEARVRLERITLDSGIPEMTIEHSLTLPLELAGGDSFTINLRFAPLQSSPINRVSDVVMVESWNLLADEPFPIGRIVVTGTVGRARLDVEPNAIDFHRVAVRTIKRLPVQMINSGSRALRLRSSVLGSDVFRLEKSDLVIQPHSSRRFEIAFEPTRVGVENAEVVFASDGLEQPETRVPLEGRGIAVTDCRLSLTPAALDFAFVQPFHHVRQPIVFENVGGEYCVVSDFMLAIGSSPQFYFEMQPREMTIQPSGLMTVFVTFRPTDTIAASGGLRYYVSDLNSKDSIVTFVGQGAGSDLLVVPNELNFGKVDTGCLPPPDREIRIYNDTMTLSLQNTSITASTSQAFQLLMPPSPGTILEPGTSISFDVQLNPPLSQFDAALLNISTLPFGHFVVPVFGESDISGLNEERFVQFGSNPIDILVVFDDSGSMSQGRDDLIRNLSELVGSATRQGINYQLAVTTTDVNPLSHSGQFVDAENPEWRIINGDDVPSPEYAFSRVARFTSSGFATEQGLEAAKLALTTPLVTGWNQGIMRENAQLAVLFVSDEPDQSPGTEQYYYDALLSIVGVHRRNWLAAHAIVGDSPSGCSGGSDDARPGPRYIALANRTGGTFQSICMPDIQELGEAIFGPRATFFIVNRANPNSIEVEVNGSLVSEHTPSGSTNWIYDQVGRFISFSPTAIPPAGSEIVIRYITNC